MSILGGRTAFKGSLQVKKISNRFSWLDRVKRRLSNSFWALRGGLVIYAKLSARHYIASEDRWVDKGVLGYKVVTTEFVNFLVDELQSADATFNDFKFHDYGTGTTGENIADVTMETATGEARESGTQVEGASVNIYRSVATHTFAGSFAITEHGLFNAAAPADKLMDRTVFGAINVVSSDKIEFTYELTCSAGG